MSSPYKAVFFDAGGTLLRVHPSVGDVYARVARRYGMNVGAERINELFHHEFSKRDHDNAAQIHSSERNEREFWRKLVFDIFSKLTEVRSFDLFFEELYHAFGSGEVWQLYPEVMSVLDELDRRKITMGIVSNWDSRLFSICKSLHLSHRFGFTIASAVLGFAKPDRRIFDEAVRLSKAANSEVIHIGDSLDHDYQGAKRAGLKALYLNRSSISTPSDVHSVKSLDALLDLL